MSAQTTQPADIATIVESMPSYLDRSWVTAHHWAEATEAEFLAHTGAIACLLPVGLSYPNGRGSTAIECWVRHDGRQVGWGSIGSFGRRSRGFDEGYAPAEIVAIAGRKRGTPRYFCAD